MTAGSARSSSPAGAPRPEPRRGLIGHSLVYGIAQVAAAVASVALLPIYTAALAPRDFGAVAVLELAMTVVASLTGISIGSAATRLHFKSGQSPHAVWTTGLVVLLAQCGAIVAVGWLAREPLASLLFGPTAEVGVGLMGLVLALTVVNLLSGFAFAYVRALERSALFLGITLGGLALRIGLNLWLLVVLQWGVPGYLWSGAIAGAVQSAVLLLVLFARRTWSFDRGLWRAIASFAFPISIAALAALAMHQADLWVLRVRLGDLSQIGLYAFAYAIVQRSNSLLLTPFSSIWITRLYELDSDPHRREAYHRVFRGFTLVSCCALLALALCARPVVELLASPEYGSAAELVPILGIAFFLFSLHDFFVVPALLAGRGGAIAWTAVAAASVGIALCIVLAPIAGIRGAAIASVVTYAVYSFGGHLRYRRYEDLRYPFGHLVRLASVAAAAWLTRPSPPDASSPWVELALAVSWSVLAAAVAVLWCGRDLLRPPPALEGDRAVGAVVERATARQEVDAV